MSQRTQPVIGVYGPGRVGLALARAAERHGLSVVLCGRDRLRADAAAAAHGVPSDSVDQAMARVDLLAVTTPDDAVGSAAESIARWGRPGLAVVHVSGVLGLAPLAPLAQRGSPVGAWHPAQAFPSQVSDIQPGIAWGITADEPLVGVLVDLTERFGGRPLLLAESDRPRYHAAAAMASNYTAVLLNEACGVLARCGIDRSQALEALLPLVRSSLDALASDGLPRGLTGPAVRGDVGTLRLHLDVLAEEPMASELYRACGRAALTVLRERGLSEQTITAVADLMRSPTSQPG